MKEKGSTPNTIRLALAAVIAHAVVVALHSTAHQILGVQASPLQMLFIVTVIIIAPPLAGVLLWKDFRWPGAMLLAASMAGSLIFGVYNHFVAHSPDHVSQVSSMSPAGWAVVFQVTALLLSITEALGICAGVLIMERREAE